MRWNLCLLEKNFPIHSSGASQGDEGRERNIFSPAHGNLQTLSALRFCKDLTKGNEKNEKHILLIPELEKDAWSFALLARGKNLYSRKHLCPVVSQNKCCQLLGTSLH